MVTLFQLASEHNQNASRTDNDNLTNNETIPSPIVFAVTVWEAGSKCVDYYMTWRAKTVSNILFLIPYPTFIVMPFLPETSTLQRKAPDLSSFFVLGLT